MDITHIASLLKPFLGDPLPDPILEQISTYVDLLLRWNARINLTAIRQPDQIITRHFGESLFMARHLFPKPESESGLRTCTANPAAESSGVTTLRVIDIGSGAGFPGIPLKLWNPSIELILIEANHKKAAFLRELSRTLTLTNVDVKEDRAEALATNPSFERADLITLRAVERFESILPTAITLLRPKATLATLIGASQVLLLKTSNIQWNPPIPLPLSHTSILILGNAS